jgi:hypothetical protein
LPVLKFYLTPIKDNFFTLLGGALKFQIVPLKASFAAITLLWNFTLRCSVVSFARRLRVALEFYVALKDG